MSEQARPAMTQMDTELFRGRAAAPARFGRYPGLDPEFQTMAAAEATRLAEDIERPAATVDRLAALRAELRRRNLAGFIIPLTDEYRGEYLPKRAQRLTWLTGFTGSAGLAIVLAERAAVWSDGRYTLQLRAQVDQRLFELHHLVESPPTDWLARNLPPGTRAGYDPWLHTVDGVAKLKDACAQAQAELVACADNPVDTVWIDQPPAPLAPAVPHDVRFAGEDSAAKRARIARELASAGTDAAVLTLPESVAWLLNMRGGDVPHTPLPLGMALLQSDARVDLFIDRRKVGPALIDHLGNAVAIHEPAEFGPALDGLGQNRKIVLADPQSAPAWVFDRLTAAGAMVRRDDDPCLLPKACKNPIELAGARAAHVRDGAAVAHFLCWLAKSAPAGGVDEIAAAARLEEFRRQNDLIQDLSFTTISGTGPNGAIVHYRVTPASNRKLEPGQLYLIDSGAQYLDGTTDITRTVAIGRPTAEMRDRFTRVLKGHIAIATARFPAGTSGQQLDALARRSLWDVGLDYDHGTGHGVGSFLGVHEGPQRIAKAGSAVALRPGMIVSNEPGYYKAGAFGIRIENLVVVTALADLAGAEKPMLGFETLTRAPIDLALVELRLMTAAEIAWLDAYHAEVRTVLTPLVDPETAAWLAAATRPVSVQSAIC